MDLPDPESLLEEQVAYYRARAPEYDDWWLRVGRYDDGDDEAARRWEAGRQGVAAAVEDFAPTGDVLELAAGTGNLTRELCRWAGHVTAVDASEEALAIARSKVPETSVTFVHADVFSWEPPRRFDVVAFGFWLSHVPPGRMEQFWALIDDALRPDGRVFFTDNAVPVEHAFPDPWNRGSRPWSATWLDHGVSVRTLSDGRRFHIVKRAWTPEELERELANLGWQATVASVDDLFIHGSARRANR